MTNSHPPGLPSADDSYIQFDGEDRVPRLPSARFILVSPSAAVNDPVHVAILWPSGIWEQPVAGSRLWHAVLDRRMAELDSRIPEQRILQDEIRLSAERFPDLESWWKWLRSGWTAPPDLGESEHHHRERGS